MTAPRDELLTVQQCPAAPTGAPCACACPDGACTHTWDGPTVTSDDGLSQSATCSRCGMSAMDHDLWVMP